MIRKNPKMFYYILGFIIPPLFAKVREIYKNNIGLKLKNLGNWKILHFGIEIQLSQKKKINKFLK